ncbi:RES family NAD+ phosphorylase [Chryseobacterium sp. PTM-20240506]|uniref:RES family NAD+ phosphorylase n=1 Tax=Chryseobacterium sp. PTM-20240506 TaxID=3400631 RepID=UPI00293C329E|nr:RES family NAD+ phosphorylase [Elizabethkingia anophelis]MDV3596577.1 hypothetical protein [Elizabethkingia anophelis]
MNCCIGCFESHYLKQIILTNNTKGDCDFCDSKQVNVYNAEELNIFFKGLLDLYEVDEIEGDSIENQIQKDFPGKVFTQTLITRNNTKTLLINMMSEESSDYADVLSKPVILKFHKTDYEERIVKPLVFSWENFSREIKSVNRFHFQNSLDLEKLKEIFAHYKKEIIKGKNFYRARISSDKSGYLISEMGNPPNSKASDGRANPKGISYLYLSNDIKTALFEVRANLYDYISVAKFKLKENLQVINLSSKVIDIFTFLDNDLLEEQIIHQPFISRLEQELAKPHRKSDSELDYLPTQYISELIKSMGFDGIEFKSAQNPDGYNLAIFHPGKFDVISVEVVEVTNLDIEYQRVEVDI